MDFRIATKIMSGIKDPETKTKLLAVKEDEFNLNKIVDICRTEESAHKNERKLSSRNVNLLHHNKETKSQPSGGFNNNRFNRNKPRGRSRSRYIKPT